MNLINTFFRNNALNRSLLTFFLVAFLTGCGGGSSDATTGAGGDPSQVGTWTLSTIDGVAVPAGSVTLTLTESTYSAILNIEGVDCTETGTYTVSGGTSGTLNSTISTASGGCSDPVGTTYTDSYTVTATTLTIVEEDGTTSVYTRT